MTKGLSRTLHQDKCLSLVQEWERAVTQMANIADLAAELGEAKEAKGRAEAKVETMLEIIDERLKNTREERDAARAERDAVLAASKRAGEASRGCRSSQS